MTPADIKLHWDSYYKTNDAPTEPSSFAVHCLPTISKTQPLLEVGCGNGRDALFFADHGLQVTACDASAVTISKLKKIMTSTKQNNPRFLEADITNLPIHGYEVLFGTIYARFVLHAISAIGQESLLRWASANLVPGGLLMVEARSVNSNLYGKGQPVGKDAFIFNHYRRFIRKEELVNQLINLGFEIKECVESDGLAINGKDNPVVIRIQAKK